MGIYAATLPGRKRRVLVRAGNQSEAAKRFVTLEHLSAEDMQDALDNGETVWREGTPFPPDDAEETDADTEAEQATE